MNIREFFTTNAWWGKILGAFFGYLIAGPIGAFFGILIGNFFDRGLSQYFSNPHWPYFFEKTKEIQKQFFEATFFIMGYIAKVDGRVSEAEIKMAQLLMGEMRLNSLQKKQAQHLFNEGKDANFQISPILLNLKQSCINNPDLLKLFIDIQYRAAQVDGLTAKKIQALNTVITHLGFVPLNQQYRFYEDFVKPSANEPSQRTASALDHAYALLEIKQSATKQEVKKAYRRCMSHNHPDKLIAQGLPQAMINIANDKTQKINKAYQLICETKGW